MLICVFIRNNNIFSKRLIRIYADSFKEAVTHKLIKGRTAKSKFILFTITTKIMVTRTDLQEGFVTSAQGLYSQRGPKF